MSTASSPGAVPLVSLSLTTEQDVFVLRRSGKTAARSLGVEPQDQIRLATALSELGRDLIGSCELTVSCTLVGRTRPRLRFALVWKDGPGPGAEALRAASRLVALEHLPVERSLVIEQPLGVDAPAPALVERTRQALRTHKGATAVEDARAQTVDLIAALEESRAQREELRRLNAELEETNRGVMALYSELSEELEETNRGVVALYAELEEKSRQLREASEAKTRFWANVSHELRTPVNAVVGLARMLLEFDAERLDEEQHRQVSLIAASGATLLALVDELLDVAKAESGRLEPNWGPVDLRALLGQLTGVLRGYARHGDAELVVAEPELTVVSDEVMLTRVLRNLLSNALKFTESGTVRLDVATEGGAGDEFVVFTVTDTGVGIPEAEQQQIFEEFYQVRGPHQRGRSGTGLGLPYARRLTELLGGTLALTSAPGQGTEVTVRLPVRSSPSGAGGEVAGGPLLAVLVTADDDDAFRAAVRPLLEQLAERVVEVDRGGRTCAVVREERPDAVLLDLQMPDLDGYAVLAELAADPELRGVPVVVVTSARWESLDHGRLRHARTVLDKASLSPAQLTAVFTEHVLRGDRAERGDGAERGESRTQGAIRKDPRS
ncbi:ATP-binding response regulator [Streptomyces fragilis]|uniref:histidine kinase n=1 Tax=Streptomyces fragilis TaxID=67301 RepID=A0ABV2YM54_9ACTN|nr:hybrid sensor histidine kinase/response regulator [Streptomyces fragilis]